MAKRFHAVDRHTGEKWKPNKSYHRHYLVMYDSGYLAEVIEDFYTSVQPLDTSRWRAVLKNSSRHHAP